MTCYHPLKRFKLPSINPNTGLPDGIVCSYSTDILTLEPLGSFKKGNWYQLSNKTDHGKIFLQKNGLVEGQKKISYKYTTDWQPIPCGQCIGCRIDYSRNWANRIMMESIDKESYFITLTYNPNHVPLSTYIDKEHIDEETGELIPDTKRIAYTLDKKDLVNFIKRLRRKLEYRGLPTDFKYFACGEYGGKYARSHYHLCIIGLHLDDLEFYKDNFNSQKYFFSRFLESCWTDATNTQHNLVVDEFNDHRKCYQGSKGYVVVAPLSWQSAAYTARYVVKKHKGYTADYYKQFNIEPEFCLMSKGIGKDFYIDNKHSIYLTDEIILSTPGYKNGSICFKPPRYFDKFAEVDHDILGFSRLKDSRIQFAENLVKLKMEQKDMDYLSLLKEEEEHFKKATRSLVRNL